MTVQVKDDSIDAMRTPSFRATAASRRDLAESANG